MKFSIIMPAFNCEHFIDEAIQSVVNQTYENWELILIDDGSTDRTWEKIQEWQASDKRILGFTQANSGKPSKARNRGVEKATGDYICFLDSDDYFSTSKLQLFNQFFNKHKQIELCFSDLKTSSEDDEVIKSKYLEDRSFLKLSNEHISFREQKEIVFNDSFYHFMCCVMTAIYTITIVIRSDLLKDIGKFDENFVVGEDVDLWFRLALSRPVGYIDEALACYRMNSNSITKENERYMLGTYFTHSTNLLRASAVLSNEERHIYKNKVSEMAEHLGYFYRVNGQRENALRYYKKSYIHKPSAKGIFNLLKAYLLSF